MAHDQRGVLQPLAQVRQRRVEICPECSIVQSLGRTRPRTADFPDVLPIGFKVDGQHTVGDKAIHNFGSITERGDERGEIMLPAGSDLVLCGTREPPQQSRRSNRILHRKLVTASLVE